MTNSTIFGLGWIDKGANIKQTPLVNTVAMCGKEAPVVVPTCDCKGHMVYSAKKDVEFIMEYFSKKVDAFDSKGSNINCFFLDGAANVQRVGFIHVTYLRAMTFHGRDYVGILYCGISP